MTPRLPNSRLCLVFSLVFLAAGSLVSAADAGIRFVEPAALAVDLVEGSASPLSVYGLAAGDFDGDGHVDLAAGADVPSPFLARFVERRGAVLLFRGYGDGTFAPAVVVAGGLGAGDALGLAAGDFNGDGLLDLMVALRQDQEVVFLAGQGDGRFRAPVSTPLSRHPVAIQAADLDGDGDLDLVARSVPDGWLGIADRSISVLMGNGDGTFAEPVDLDFSGVPMDLALADVDGANGPDIVAAVSGSPGVLAWFLNDGAGGFSSSPQTLALEIGPALENPAYMGLYVADFDGDGRADAAVAGGHAAGGSSGTLALCRNSGAGGFLPPTSDGYQPIEAYPVRGYGPSTAPDLDGDGAPDVVFLHGDANFATVGLNDGSGGFRLATYVALPSRSSDRTSVDLLSGSSSAVADFNSDGRPDLAVAAAAGKAGGGVSVLLGAGGGVLRSPRSYAASEHQALFPWLALADADNDDDLDLLALVAPFDVLPGAGDATFGPASPGVGTRSVGYDRVGLQAGDFDGDGNVDAVWVDYSLYVAPGKGDGTFADPVAYPFTAPYRGLNVRLADFDGDGARDVAVLLGHETVFGARKIQIWLNRLDDPDSSFVPGATLDLAGPTDQLERGMAVGDFDGDGRIDLVARVAPSAGTDRTYPEGELDFFRGNGDGTFQEVTVAARGPVSSASERVMDLQAADLDGDGDLDLVATDTDSTVIWVLLGRGDGTFADPQSYDTGIVPHRVRLADFDGDGNLDVVAVSAVGFISWRPAVSVLPGVGGGAFGAPQVHAVGTHYAGQAEAGDLDGDGDLDLVVAHDVGNWALANRFTVLVADPGPVADLAVTVDPQTGSAALGRPTILTVTVANRGPDAATQALVRIPLPPDTIDLAGAPSQGGCAVEGGELTCQLGELAAGAEAAVEVSLTPTALGELWTTVSAASNAADPYTEDNGAASRLEVRSGVTVAALDAAASESGPTPARIALSLGAPLDTPLPVTIALEGTAQVGTDYTLLGPVNGSIVTIPAGETQLTLTVVPVADDADEDEETVTLRVLPDPTGELYILPDTDSATVTLADGAPGVDLAVAGLYPPAGGNLGPVTFTVSGQGFDPEATVILRADGQDDIAATRVEVNAAGTQLTATVDLVGIPLGAYDVVVTNPDGTSQTLPASFTVETGTPPQIWVDLLGRDAVRVNSEYRLTLLVGNESNIDIPCVVVMLSGIPEGGTVSYDRIRHGPPDARETPTSETSSIDYIDRGTRSKKKAYFVYVYDLNPGEVNSIPVSISFNESDVGKQDISVSVLELPREVGVVFTKTATTKTQDIENAKAPKAEKLMNVSVRSISNRVAGLTMGVRNIDRATSKEFISPEDRDALLYVARILLSRYGEDNVISRANNGACVKATKDRNADLFSRAMDPSDPDNPLYGWEIRSITGFGYVAADGTARGAHTMTMLISPHTGRAYGMDNYWRIAVIPMIQVGKDSWIVDPDIGLSHNADYMTISSLVGFGQVFVDLETLEIKLDDADLSAIIGYFHKGSGSSEHVTTDQVVDAVNNIINNSNIDFRFDPKRLVEAAIWRPTPENESYTCVYPAGIAARAVTVAAAIDPNDKVASQGAGSSHYVAGDEPLRYAVYFENKPEATAPAQVVQVVDPLDPALVDLDTLELGPITVGEHVVEPPPGVDRFAATLDLRPDGDWIVGIEAGLDRKAGTVTWTFRTIDPDTGLPIDPADVDGFLPPNTDPPAGEGSVSFVVRPRPGLPTGTQVCNQASIVFDANDPIVTSERCNVLDNDPPESAVMPLDPTQTRPAFTVTWSGSDEGSGVLDYTVYVAEDDGPFTPWIAQTQETSATFHGTDGSAYAFYVVARDAVGNAEDAPVQAQATTTVPIPATGDGDTGPGDEGSAGSDAATDTPASAAGPGGGGGGGCFIRLLGRGR